MKRHLTLLVCARDAGAAGHLSVVVQRAQEAPDLVVLPHAGPAAVDALRSATRLPAIEFPGLVVPSARAVDAAALLDMARRIVEKVAPDAVLVGLSGPGAGLDEALLQVCRDIPTLAFQDFWGDVNLTLGEPADVYLVMDEEAARLSREMHGVETAVVGAPKYARYSSMDLPGAVADGGIHPHPVVGFAGQPLGEWAGYRRTLAHLAREVAEHLPSACVVYRPHPRETEVTQDDTMQALAQHHDNCRLDAEGSAEDFLLRCDVLCSAFSTCSTDLLYMNRFSSSPLATPLHLLVDEELRDLYRSWTGLEHHPLAALGLARTVENPGEIGGAIEQALPAAARRSVWRDANTALPDPTGAADSVLEVIRGAVEARR